MTQFLLRRLAGSRLNHLEATEESANSKLCIPTNPRSRQKQAGKTISGSYFASTSVSSRCLVVPLQDSDFIQLLGLDASRSVRQKKGESLARIALSDPHCVYEEVLWLLHSVLHPLRACRDYNGGQRVFLQRCITVEQRRRPCARISQSRR